MTDAIIHIGLGKTGSSSLQTFLSHGGLNETPFEYCAIESSGHVISGRALNIRAENTPLGYVSSTFSPIEVDCSKTRSGLRKILASGKIPVLSQEYWSNLGSSFLKNDLLKSWRIYSPMIVTYVRPQVEYINTGWWQWWVWSGQFSAPKELIKAWGLNLFNWSAALAPWAEQGDLRVRLHAGDTVDDFLTLIGSEKPPRHQERKNQGMSLELIQLYRSMPGLRTPHRAMLDALLAPLVEPSKTPWALDAADSQFVISELREHNLRLAELMTPGHQAAMLANPRWWDASSYPQSAEDIKTITNDRISAILLQAYPRLIDTCFPKTEIRLSR